MASSQGSSVYKLHCGETEVSREPTYPRKQKLLGFLISSGRDTQSKEGPQNTMAD